MTIALDSAISGLRIAQLSLDIASRNISNASTPGYTRKILPQENLLIAGSSVGVRALAISRTVNYSLISDLNRQIGIAGGYDVRMQYLERIQSFHGASDSGRSLSSHLSRLANAFASLSTAPNDQILIGQTLSAAAQTAGRINEFAGLLNDMRNNAEGDIAMAVAEVNASIDRIAGLNATITRLNSFGQSAADLEDQRDAAIRNIAKYLDIKTFASGDSITVMTAQGQILADSGAHKLYFTRSSILPGSFYPGGGLSGLAVESPGGTDIAQTGLGGQIGALFELRDSALPRYAAQLDEFTQRLAERFESQGLRLFTGADGSVPLDDPNQPPPLGYAGLSFFVKVNEAVAADPSLIRHGTSGNTELPGSNEVIRRIVQFALGPYRHQQAQGSADISAGALIPALGLAVRNSVVGTASIAGYSPDLSGVPGLTLPASFNLTIGGAGPLAIAIAATDSAADVVSTVNAAFGSTVCALNSAGQLTFFADNSAITIADNTIGAGGMAALGFSFGATPQPSASFQVQVGTRAAATIQIAPGDTSVELLAALNAVPGLSAALDGSGRLVLTPTEGGDLRLTDGAGAPLAALGMAVSNVAHTPFAQSGLGPDGSLSTGLLANSTLQDYANSIISLQSEEYNAGKSGQEQEAAFLKTLDSRNENISGVNIDQEMSELIRIQSAYSAAAKMITTTQTLFETLLNAVK